MNLKFNFYSHRMRVALIGILTILLVGFFFNNCSGGFQSAGSTISQSSTSSSAGSNSGSSGATTANQGMATLTWQAPTQNTDGSSLTDLAGYHIYYGSSQNALNQMITVSNPATTTYQIDNLGTGTWYFAVAAYSTSGTESARSNVGSKTFK